MGGRDFGSARLGEQKKSQSRMTFFIVLLLLIPTVFAISDLSTEGMVSDSAAQDAPAPAVQAVPDHAAELAADAQAVQGMPDSENVADQDNAQVSGADQDNAQVLVPAGEQQATEQETEPSLHQQVTEESDNTEAQEGAADPGYEEPTDHDYALAEDADESTDNQVTETDTVTDGSVQVPESGTEELADDGDEQATESQDPAEEEARPSAAEEADTIEGSQPQESTVTEPGPVNESTDTSTDSGPEQNTTAPVQEGSQTLPVTNQTLPVTNQTLPEENQTLPEENQTIPVTNQTVPVQANTSDRPGPEPVEIEPVEQAVLDISIELPDRVTRGEPFVAYAELTNMGDGTARSVSMEWLLPYGFSASDTTKQCSELAPGDVCSGQISVTAEPPALGLSEIKVIARYNG